MDVKNQPEEEILRQAVFLRSAAGRATHVKVAPQAAPSLRVSPVPHLEKGKPYPPVLHVQI